MISRILSTSGIEFRIALRNRWVAIAIVLMVVFALVLAAAGAAPTGDIGADRLSVTVASLTSLAVYLVPLLALLMSFDAIAGEVERGTLPLLLTYPVSRAEILAGKLIAQVTILAIAVTVGYGAAAGMTLWLDPGSYSGLPALWRLIWSSVLLGAAFLGLGFVLSSLAGRPSGAAGMAIGLWLALVVLYDLALLAMIVADGGGALTTQVLPVALVVNPADAFRLFNLSASEATAAAAGIGGAANSIPLWQSTLSLGLWPLIAFVLAILAFRRVTP